MVIEQLSYFTFSCIQCSLENIVKTLSSDFLENGKRKLSFKPFMFDLYDICPLKGGVHFEKAYFFMPPTNRNVCVMYSNLSDGWNTLARWLSSKIQCDCYNFQITNIDSPDSMNSFQFIQNGINVRTVYAMKDPKWIFYENGIIQWFESESYYKRKFIKNRLNKDILLSYCAKLGFTITDDKFWESKDAVLFERIQ
ncbi:hypothetical protein NXW80_06765 [Bacteroides fragilis]|nr:hypothetical protein [Bacteroides fragilis]